MDINKLTGITLFGYEIASWGDKEADARQEANDLAINKALNDSNKSTIDIPTILFFIVVLVLIYFLFK